MSEEKEIKLMLADSESGLLTQLSNQLPLTSSVIQTDHYYDNENYFFTQRDKGLRARFVNSKPVDFTFKALFYFPKRKPSPWYVEEHAFKLPVREIKPIQTIFERFNLQFTAKNKNVLEYADIHQNFAQNNLSPKIIIEKHRKTFTYKDAEVIWDEVKNLGCFIEIETQTSSPKKIAQELGIADAGKQTMEGYASLMYRKLGLPEMKEKESNYIANPYWNVFEKEKRIYEELANQTEKRLSPMTKDWE